MAPQASLARAASPGASSVSLMNLLCVDHLTDLGQIEIPAVTIWNGFALCAHCARSRESQLEEISRDLPTPPPFPLR